jgi:hypothetical protein
MSDYIDFGAKAFYLVGHYAGSDGTNYISLFIKNGDSMSFLFDGSVPIDVQVVLFYSEDITTPQFVGDFSIFRSLKIFAKIEKSPDSSDVSVSLFEEREIKNEGGLGFYPGIKTRNFSALITPENKCVEAIPS